MCRPWQALQQVHWVLEPGLIATLPTPNMPHIRRRLDDFKILKLLGEGTLSTVTAASCKVSGAKVAIKSYHKDRMTGIHTRQVAREACIHAELSHPRICPLYAAFEDADGIHLVQELAEHGEGVCGAEAGAAMARGEKGAKDARLGHWQMGGRFQAPRDGRQAGGPCSDWRCLAQHPVALFSTAPSFPPSGDVYASLSRQGGFMQEEYVVQEVLNPLLQAVQYLHGKVRMPGLGCPGGGAPGSGLAVLCRRSGTQARESCRNTLPPRVAQGVMHRDIKPENVLLTASGAKLADFGLAIDTSKELPLSRVGTLDYLAPEVGWMGGWVGGDGSRKSCR